QARAVQHSEGQHDDLACFPGARSRESGHRGAAASWHGSGAPRRHARRVVSAAPDAWTSFGVTGSRTRSLALAVSVFRETGFWGQRKKRRNDLPTVTIPSLRTNRRTDPRPSGAFRTPSGNLR